MFTGSTTGTGKNEGASFVGHSAPELPEVAQSDTAIFVQKQLGAGAQVDVTPPSTSRFKDFTNVDSSWAFVEGEGEGKPTSAPVTTHADRSPKTSPRQILSQEDQQASIELADKPVEEIRSIESGGKGGSSKEPVETTKASLPMTEKAIEEPEKPRDWIKIAGIVIFVVGALLTVLAALCIAGLLHPVLLSGPTGVAFTLSAGAIIMAIGGATFYYRWQVGDLPPPQPKPELIKA